MEGCFVHFKDLSSFYIVCEMVIPCEILNGSNLISNREL